jgi:NAD-dependent dihydropyrimidine dehydrogenase PreA subunit
MKAFFNRKNSKTQFIQFNSKNCRACWECIENCPNEVLGKIDFLGHKHARIENPDKCTGCLNCISVCEFNALSEITPVVFRSQSGLKKVKAKFNTRAFVSIAMLISGLLLPVSGVMNHNLQFELLTTQRHFWMSVHNMSAFLFTTFTIIHIILNRKVLKNYLTRVKMVLITKEAAAAFTLIIFIVALFSAHAFLAR